MTNTGWTAKLHKADLFEEGRTSDVSDQCLFDVCVAVQGLLSPGVPGVPWYPQILADQLTLYPPGEGGRLCSPNDTGTPGFSDLPTALPECCTKIYTKKYWKNTSEKYGLL